MPDKNQRRKGRGELNSLRRTIERRASEAVETKKLFREQCLASLEIIVRTCIGALKKGRAIYLFGNGGSAADAQHIAAELQGSFYRDHAGMPVMALTTNTSTLTAIGNDYGYEHTFERQVEGSVRKGDVVIAISTSGNSENVLRAVARAKKQGAVTVGFTGRSGGKLKPRVDLCLCAPSSDVARIQECHILAGHILCEIVEKELDR